MKDSDCKQYPYHGSYYDSIIGDWEERCDCGICEYGDIPRCRYPLFIRHVLAFKEKMRQLKWERQAQRAYEKELKNIYKLGMNEDEYSEYQYNKMNN